MDKTKVFGRFGAASLFLGLLFVLAGFLLPRTSGAKLLSIGGNLSYSIQATKSKTAKGDKTTGKGFVNSSAPQFSLSLSGNLPTNWMGSYYGRYSWTKRTTGTCNEANKLFICKDAVDTWYRIRDYSLSVNLLPGWSPLNLNAQNIIRESGSDSTAVPPSKDRVETRGATWSLTLPRIPRIVLLYQQSELKAGTGNDIETRAASAMSDSSIGPLEVRTGYQFNETEAFKLGAATRTRSHGLNLDVQARFEEGLSLAAYVRLVKTDRPDNGVLPPAVATGVDIFPQRAYGGSVNLRPPQGWWDANASVAYSENPFIPQFEILTVSASSNLRFSDKLRTAFGAHYSDLENKGTQVSSILGSSSLSYRPIFGLSTNLGANAGYTDSNPLQSQDTETLFQNYLFGISYIKPLRRVQYRLSHSLSYGISDTRPTDSSSRNLVNTLNGGLDNTNTRYIHVGLNGSFSNIRSNTRNNTDSQKTDQNTYSLSFTADSSYFRNLLFRGDSLSLHFRDTYRNNSGFGISGRLNLIEFRGDYHTPIGLSLNGKYQYEDYPRELLLDRQIVTGSLLYSRALFRVLGFNLQVNESFEDNRFREDVNRVEGSGELSYVLGKIRMAVRYFRVEIRTAGIRQVTTSVFGQISRSF